MPSLSINPDITTANVLEILSVSGKPLHEGGRAVDGATMLSGFAGDGKQPAIRITAGVYAPETVGGQMALNLLKLTKTGPDEAKCSTGRDDHQSPIRILRRSKEGLNAYEKMRDINPNTHRRLQYAEYKHQGG